MTRQKPTIDELFRDFGRNQRVKISIDRNGNDEIALIYSMQCDLNEDRAMRLSPATASCDIASMKNERGSEISRQNRTCMYETRTVERLKSTVIRPVFSQMSRSHLRFRDSLYYAQINRDQFPWLATVGYDVFLSFFVACHCTVNHKKICQTYTEP